MEKALFDQPIMLKYDVKPKYRLISRKFSGVKFFHPSVRLTNQIALFPFVCCFCFVRAFSFQGHTKIALLTAAGFNQSLIQSHTQRKSLTMVIRKTDYHVEDQSNVFTGPRQTKNMGQTFDKQRTMTSQREEPRQKSYYLFKKTYLLGC